MRRERHVYTFDAGTEERAREIVEGLRKRLYNSSEICSLFSY